jgi:hypothetical protein
MANKRGRSGVGWFIFSFFFSAFLGMLFLACLGETEEKFEERICDEERIKIMYRKQYSSQNDSV